MSVLALAGLGLAGLYVLARGHIPEYLQWRWMVATHQAIVPVDDMHIVVDKSERQLTLYRGDQTILQYRVAISEFGPGPRRIWADQLTPEGTFLIASMQYQSIFGPRQMLLETTTQSLADYQAQYGPEGQGRLSAWETAHGPLDTIWEVYDFNKVYPDQAIWNDILIHGGGSDRDWTWGCIALEDSDLIALFDQLKRSQAGGLGVAVTIQP